MIEIEKMVGKISQNNSIMRFSKFSFTQIKERVILFAQQFIYFEIGLTKWFLAMTCNRVAGILSKIFPCGRKNDKTDISQCYGTKQTLWFQIEFLERHFDVITTGCLTHFMQLPIWFIETIVSMHKWNRMQKFEMLIYCLDCVYTKSLASFACSICMTKIHKC